MGDADSETQVNRVLLLSLLFSFATNLEAIVNANC